MVVNRHPSKIYATVYNHVATNRWLEIAFSTESVSVTNYQPDSLLTDLNWQGVWLRWYPYRVRTFVIINVYSQSHNCRNLFANLCVSGFERKRVFIEWIAVHRSQHRLTSARLSVTGTVRWRSRINVAGSEPWCCPTQYNSLLASWVTCYRALQCKWYIFAHQQINI